MKVAIVQLVLAGLFAWLDRSDAAIPAAVGAVALLLNLGLTAVGVATPTAAAFLNGTALVSTLIAVRRWLDVAGAE